MTNPAYINGYSIVGIGWPWGNSGPQFKTDFDWIEDALTRIIFTQIRDMKMSPTFGSALIQVLFENQGPVFEALADVAIREAIELNIPYVDVVGLEFNYNEGNEGQVDIEVEYIFNNKKNNWSGTYGGP